MDPRMSDPEYQRRQDVRYETKLKAMLQVPLDEDGSAYLKANAWVVNVSQVGLAVEIKELPPHHAALLKTPDLICSVSCEIPDVETSPFLTGKVAWVKIDGDGPLTGVSLGLHLTETQYREHYRLLRYIDKLRRAARRMGDEARPGLK